MSQNPLLNLDGLIDFAAIRPEHVAPAIRELIAEAQKTLDAVTKPEVPADFDSVAETLTTATLRLSRAWGAVSHLMSVNDSEALRSVFNEMLPEVTQFWIGLSQNESLYGKYKAMHDAAGFESLTPVRQKIINDENLIFRSEKLACDRDSTSHLFSERVNLSSEDTLIHGDIFSLLSKNHRDI